MSEALQRWEYRAFTIDPELLRAKAQTEEVVPDSGVRTRRLENLEIELDRLGEEGWELVGADVTGQGMLLLKRPKRSKPGEPNLRFI
jgi:hypothetical protein